MSDETSLHFVDAWGQAWDDFRNSGPADVRAALKWAQHRIEELEDKVERAERVHQTAKAKGYRQDIKRLKRRCTGLSMLLDHMVDLGPSNVPAFDEMIVNKRAEWENTDPDKLSDGAIEVLGRIKDYIKPGTRKEDAYPETLRTLFKKIAQGEKPKNVRERLHSQLRRKDIPKPKTSGAQGVKEHVELAEALTQH